jgi:hypothetical protein
MQGIFLDGKRPKSKKAIVEAVRDNPTSVEIEPTSWFGNEYGGLAVGLAEGQKVYFVGPDPHKSRKFYGQIVNKAGKLRVS